jgi:hypothetical protein
VFASKRALPPPKSTVSVEYDKTASNLHFSRQTVSKPQMNLRNFNTQTISGILSEVSDARGQAPEGMRVAPPLVDSVEVAKAGFSSFQTVEFDVAITVESKGKGTPEIQVLAFKINGVGNENSQSQVSRMKFKVPVSLGEVHPHADR